MKNLSKEELLDRIHTKRDATHITYEALTNPDYDTWGRARFWTVNQAVCLLAGLWPICKEYFEILIKAGSVIPLAEWFSCYPVQQTDLNRLKNLYRLVNERIPLKDRDLTNLGFSPQQLLDECKKDALVKASLPAQLVKVVEKLGAHTDLDLPDSFHFLEINPRVMQTMKALEAGSLAASKPHIKKEISVSKESPIEIARRLFPLQNKEPWKKASAFSPCEILLLYYEIEPVDILVKSYTIPGKLPEKSVQELQSYIANFYGGDRQLFVLAMDATGLWDLLRRAISIGEFSMPAELIHPFYSLGIKKEQLLSWMKAKNLSFPLFDEEKTTGQSSKEIQEEVVLNYDLTKLRPPQLARYHVRGIVATIVKKDKGIKHLKDIIATSFFKNSMKLFYEATGKEYDQETIRGWIRDFLSKKSQKNRGA